MSFYETLRHFADFLRLVLVFGIFRALSDAVLPCGTSALPRQSAMWKRPSTRFSRG